MVTQRRALTTERSSDQSQSGSGFSVWSLVVPCLRGFTPGAPVSSHMLKIHKLQLSTLMGASAIIT